MKKIFAVLLCVLCLVGCGKRGKLEFPPNTTYPRQYPVARNPQSVEKTKREKQQEDKQPQSIWEINQSLESEQ